MGDNGKIRAKFMVTHTNVTIVSDFKGIQLTIAWKREGDPEATARNLRTLVGNLPDVLKEGLREIYVSDQAKRIDYDLEQLFRDEDEKHVEKPEEFDPGPLDGLGDQ